MQTGEKKEDKNGCPIQASKQMTYIKGKEEKKKKKKKKKEEKKKLKPSLKQNNMRNPHP